MSDILFETAGRAGIVTLNRPKALNALTQRMIEEMADGLTEWAEDDRIARVVIRSAGGKAFCAGGDIRDVHKRRSDATPFFSTEYKLNTRIHHYPKPYVALIDGLCMGGGVGVTMHGSHVLASENLVFAMPEVAIGLFPDVGASYLLSRLPGEAGLHLALTGARLGRDGAAGLGLVTHPTEAGRLDDALDRIAHARDLDVALDELQVEVEPRDKDEAALIDRAFARDSVAAILEHLEGLDEEFAVKAIAAMRAGSPTSVRLSFEEVRRAREKSFADCMRMEFRILCRVLEGHDLYEGVRARLIDKDQAPKWSPATLEGVDAEMIEEHFRPLPEGELDLTGVEETAEAR